MTNAIANGVRCIHGLKAGNCNTCPATRDAESNLWTFDAIGVKRTRTVAGTRYRSNRHGVLYREDGLDADGKTRWHLACMRVDDETYYHVRRSFDLAGVVASCSRSGICSCPARF